VPGSLALIVEPDWLNSCKGICIFVHGPVHVAHVHCW
jgi:hypothetical protein